MTSPLTAAGSLVGTFQYMSPEQIDGKEADARSDIFAFGAVMYEMFTGKRAFEGKSQISVASAILEKDPEPVSGIRTAISPNLEHVISRALSKDPEKRWQSAADIREELEWIRSSAKANGLTPSTKPSVQPWQRGLLALSALLALLGIGATAIAYWKHPQPQLRRLVAAIPHPDDLPFELTGDIGAPPVISPDGASLVFGANDQIWIRSLESGQAHPLEGTENGSFPFWAPDSRRIGFFSGGKLRVVDTSGGGPITICDAPNARGGTWNPNGVILLAPNIRNGLFRVPASGGTPVPVTTLDTSKHSTHRWPQFLPDGDHFVYLAANHAGQHEFSGIYVGSLSHPGSEGSLLLRTDANAIYAMGYLLFVRQDDLLAQPFDLRRLQVTGDPIRITEKVLNDQGIWRGVFSASANGDLVYTAGVNSAAEGQLTWFDRNGRILGTLAERGSNSPRVSPDGRRVAIEYGEPNPDIWIFDIVSGVRNRLASDSSASTPIWSRDGKNIAYLLIPGNSSKGRIAIRAADGTGAARLFAEEDPWESPSDWSPDGKYLLYDRGEPGATDIYAMPLAADQKPFPLVSTPTWERGAVFSPDGHWVAYSSRESGRDQVYITPFPGPGPKWQISSAGGNTPRWRRDGKALFAINGDSVLEFPISASAGSIKAGDPKVLFQTAVGETLLFDAGYDIAPDGRLIINSLGKSRIGNRPLTLEVNWTAGLRP
jgi:Tol biopolymer transport system component